MNRISSLENATAVVTGAAGFIGSHLAERLVKEKKKVIILDNTDSGRMFVDGLLQEYLPIIILLGLAVGLGIILLLAAFFLAVRSPDAEKVSAYECGFAAFDDARMKFDVRFYLVAILFIIFDLEIAFLFPWAISLGNIGILGFTSMMIFLFILTIGFIYEWKKGALDWE